MTVPSPTTPSSTLTSMTDEATVDGDVVLLVTARGDETGDAVEAALKELERTVIRMDIGDFPARLRLALTNDGRQWRGRLWTDDAYVDVDQVRSVYYRRPTHFSMAPGLSDGDAAFAKLEARIGFGGAFASLGAAWVNNPARVAFAEYKPVQLNVAAAVGMVTPRTLITNDYDELQNFASTVDGPVVCKAFSSLVLSAESTPKAVFTTIIDPATVDPRQLAVTAHLVQEWIPKDFEVRVTMIGHQPFAAAICAGSDAAYVDWRADYPSLSYERIEVPPGVVESMIQYLIKFGLNYGAFDFVVQPDGVWRFLECNPNGQWLWLEHEISLPISTALAELLANGVGVC